MELRYHAGVFDLLRSSPTVSPQALADLAALEKSTGVRVPDSVREWYSLEYAAEMLLFAEESAYSTCTISDNQRMLTDGHPPRRQWIVGVYDSGVMHAANLDDEDDPTVECVETDGTNQDQPFPLYGRAFSEFVFTCCWENLHHTMLQVNGTASGFSSEHLNALERSFTAGPHFLRPEAPGELIPPGGGDPLPICRFQYLLYSDLGTIQLNSTHNPKAGETEIEWIISSFDESDLKQLVSQVSSIGGIATGK